MELKKRNKPSKYPEYIGFLRVEKGTKERVLRAKDKLNLKQYAETLRKIFFKGLEVIEKDN